MVPNFLSVRSKLASFRTIGSRGSPARGRLASFRKLSASASQTGPGEAGSPEIGFVSHDRSCREVGFVCPPGPWVQPVDSPELGSFCTIGPQISARFAKLALFVQGPRPPARSHPAPPGNWLCFARMSATETGRARRMKPRHMCRARSGASAWPTSSCLFLPLSNHES